jgi:predicted amidohydrolase
MTGRIRVAIVQMNAGPDKARNLRKAKAWIEEAATIGKVRLIALPETFNWRGSPKEAVKRAETLEGPTSQLMADLARSLKVYLLAGSFMEKTHGQAKKVSNTSLLFDPQGKIAARYRKLHLFEAHLKGGKSVKEEKLFRAGRDVVLGKTAFGRVGLTICYDLRFPELFRVLTLRGARLIFVPSAFTRETGRAHWEPLLRARAIENQIFIVAPNQWGKNPQGITDYGRSLIVDPWGKILSRIDGGEGIATADLDFRYQDEVRRRLPSLRHPRRELIAP